MTTRTPGTDRKARDVPAVRAVLFDLDGTLIDSEQHTEEAVEAVVARYGIAGFALPATETHGRTWESVAKEIRARTSLRVDVAELAAAMLEHWVAGTAHVIPIPGAPEAIRAASASGLKLGVVSSSPRSVIDSFLDRLGVGQFIDARARIGAEAVRATKPDPHGFLLAARALEVEPAQCLVFEDSRAGLLAAQAAGMRCIFITCRATDIDGNMALATRAFDDYHALPPQFWARLAAGDCDLTQRASA